MRLEYIIQVLHTKPYLSSHLTGNSCPDNMIGKRDTVYALARSGRKRSIAGPTTGAILHRYTATEEISSPIKSLARHPTRPC
jgi:hypothetical protein